MMSSMVWATVQCVLLNTLPDCVGGVNPFGRSPERVVMEKFGQARGDSGLLLATAFWTVLSICQQVLVQDDDAECN